MKVGGALAGAGSVAAGGAAPRCNPGALTRIPRVRGWDVMEALHGRADLKTHGGAGAVLERLACRGPLRAVTTLLVR